MSIRKWNPSINEYGKVKEFVCDCGHKSLEVSDFCPSCGTKFDNSDIERRIKEAIEKNVNCYSCKQHDYFYDCRRGFAEDATSSCNCKLNGMDVLGNYCGKNRNKNCPLNDSI